MDSVGLVSQVHGGVHGSFVSWCPGVDPEISERRRGGGGGGSQILKRGAGMRLFSTAFSHFLINLLQIFHQTGGGGGGGGGGPSGLSPESAPGVTDLFFVPSQTPSRSSINCA